MDQPSLRALYVGIERFTLGVMLLALPLFGLVYLVFNSGRLPKNLPQLSPALIWGVVLVLLVLLGYQYWTFFQRIKKTKSLDSLEDKVKAYVRATRERYLYLFLISLGSTLGLLFSGNPAFIFIFAITLVFFSLGKPTPDRMARLLKLKKEDRELLREISRPS